MPPQIIEMGEAFDVLDFLTMIACVPRSYHENAFVTRIFDFLRYLFGLCCPYHVFSNGVVTVIQEEVCMLPTLTLCGCRENLGVKPIEYRDFLEQRALPIPSELSHLSRSQLLNLSSSPQNNASKLGTRRTAIYRTHDKLMQDVFAGMSADELDPLKDLDLTDSGDTHTTPRSNS